MQATLPSRDVSEAIEAYVNLIDKALSLGGDAALDPSVTMRKEIRTKGTPENTALVTSLAYRDIKLIATMTDDLTVIWTFYRDVPKNDVNAPIEIN